MNRTEMPPIKDALHFDLRLKPYDYYELNNGVPVYAIHAGAQEVLQLELVFYAGNFYESQKGIAAATNFLLKNGTEQRSAFQINEDFEYYGAYCNRGCYNETAVISLHTLSKHTDKLLPVLEDMISNSTMPEEELSIYKQNAKQRLTVNLKKSEFVADRLINGYLYGTSHPYGTSNNTDDIEAIPVDQVRAFYDRYYRNGQCAIFVAGQLPSNLIESLNRTLGGLKLSKPTFMAPDILPTPAAEKKYRIEHDANGVQGAIRIATPFPNRHHPDFKKVMVLNTVFGGFFGSRLMSNIREEKGYTYGIYSYLQNHLATTAWMISTEAGKDVAEPAIAEVYHEMLKLQTEPVGADELMLVKNYMLGSILGDLDGPFHIIGRWKNIILNRVDASYFDESIQVIKTITPEELQQLAKQYLQPEHFYELVVV